MLDKDNSNNQIYKILLKKTATHGKYLSDSEKKPTFAAVHKNH